MVTLDAQFNSQKQKNDIAGLLRQQPAAIFITPVNWEGIKEILIEAKRHGYIDRVAPDLDRLAKLGFRMGPALRQRALAECGEA